MTKKSEKQKIKLLVVDFYGVISLGSYKNTCEWIAKKYNIGFKRCYDVVYHKYFTPAALGKLSEKNSFALAAKELKLKESGRELRKKHLSFQRLNERVFNYFLKLQKQGFTILMLSKSTPGQFAYSMKLMNIKKYFKNTINTYDLGLEKSSPETLRYVLKKIRVRPKETVMIDDQDFNLVNAKKMGIKTILYKDYSSMKKKLDKILS